MGRRSPRVQKGAWQTPDIILVPRGIQKVEPERLLRRVACGLDGSQSFWPAECSPGCAPYTTKGRVARKEPTILAQTPAWPPQLCVLPVWYHFTDQGTGFYQDRFYSNLKGMALNSSNGLIWNSHILLDERALLCGMSVWRELSMEDGASVS